MPAAADSEHARPDDEQRYSEIGIRREKPEDQRDQSEVDEAQHIKRPIFPPACQIHDRASEKPGDEDRVNRHECQNDVALNGGRRERDHHAVSGCAQRECRQNPAQPGQQRIYA